MSRSAAFPSTYVITAGGPVDATWWQRFEGVLDRGHRLVQLRLTALSDTQLRPIVARAANLCRDSDCRLILNWSQGWGPAEWAPKEWIEEFGLAGLHLTSSKLMSLTARPLPADILVAASCHSVEELQKAEQIGADFACLSPVQTTSTHPKILPIGLETFSSWIRQVQLPVYALGGMGHGTGGEIHAEIDEVHRAGGQGIAGISAFWK